MTPFSTQWLSAHQGRVNADGEMAVVGRWVSTAFSLASDDRRCIVRFQSGRLGMVATT